MRCDVPTLTNAPRVTIRTAMIAMRISTLRRRSLIPAAVGERV
jgi:hypothetical protein